jgi:lipid-A-disaccharide synthase
VSQSGGILIIAGEASGDHHGAALVRAVRSKRGDLPFYGIGGSEMRAAGVETLVDCREMAVVGISEIVAHFPRLYAVLRQMRQLLISRRPALLILIDYPEFNLLLAKSARRLGIRVLYYISPQSWAWRQGRVKKIRQRVDHMAVLFPFELPFYQHAGVPATFVGHPLATTARCDLSPGEARIACGLAADRPVIGLFPGSRRSEIRRLLPILLAAGEEMQRIDPSLQFLLPRAATVSESDLAPFLANSTLRPTIVNGDFYRTIRACDAIASASGTATLEVALIGTPLVVVYRVSHWSYQILSRLIKVPHIALCNIVAGKEIVPELIQHAATPQQIATALLPLVTDAVRRKAMVAEMATLRDRLGNPMAADTLLSTVLQQLALGEAGTGE